jgi:hypothetical protein
VRAGPRHNEEDGVPRDTKHGRRIDEQMAEEVAPLTHGSPIESHRRDDRLQEAFADDEQVPENAARPDDPEGHDVSHEERMVRAELLRRIAGAEYPASRNDLLRHVGADQRGDVQARLRMLPDELNFASPEDVLGALGGMSTSDDYGAAG